MMMVLVECGNSMQHAVILNNKGGGHGEIGYHLSKALVGKGMKVTLFQDENAKMDAEPFCRYNILSGTNIKICDLKNPPNVDLDVTHIFDNYSKEPNDIEPYLIHDKNFALYTYVSSAGMYTTKGILKENHPVKESSGQRQVELALEAKMPNRWCAFRPQYIYGPYTNKRDYLDWFLNRVARNIPMAVPGDAQQPVSLTHCEDVAALLASVIGQEATAANQIFNCGTDKLFSYAEICQAAAKALNPDSLGALVATLPPDTKSTFPFRPNAEGFAVSVRKAKDVLDWPGAKHNVIDDLVGGFYTQDFLNLGLDQGDLDTSKDLLAQSYNLDYLTSA